MLYEHLPQELYHEEEHVLDLQAAIEGELTAAREARDGLYHQLRPSTADSWGLANYEREYGIVPDESKPLSERLSVWRAKRRGFGTSTVKLLTSVAGSFFEGEIEVEEHPESYSVEIILTGASAMPNRDRAPENAIKEVLPAHLGYVLHYVQKGLGDIWFAGILQPSNSLTIRQV